jgi:hypothetical protein
VAFIALVVVVAGGQTTTATKSELVVYSGGASGKAGPKLAYDVLTRGVRADQTPSRLHTIVDATTGSRLASWDEIENRTGNGQGIHVGPVSLDTTAGPLPGRCETRRATTPPTSTDLTPVPGQRSPAQLIAGVAPSCPDRRGRAGSSGFRCLIPPAAGAQHLGWLFVTI